MVGATVKFPSRISVELSVYEKPYSAVDASIFGGFLPHSGSFDVVSLGDSWNKL